MKLTTRGRYALRAILRLAKSGRERPMSLQRISEMEEISVEYLNQLFFNLRKAGIVRSTRGPRGGFSLNREPEEITAQDVLDAVGEGIAPRTASPGESPRGSGATEVRDMADSVWAGVAEHFRGYFGSMTIKKILEDANKGSLDPTV